MRTPSPAVRACCVDVFVVSFRVAFQGPLVRVTVDYAAIEEILKLLGTVPRALGGGVSHHSPRFGPCLLPCAQAANPPSTRRSSRPRTKRCVGSLLRVKPLFIPVWAGTQNEAIRKELAQLQSAIAPLAGQRDVQDALAERLAKLTSSVQEAADRERVLVARLEALEKSSSGVATAPSATPSPGPPGVDAHTAAAISVHVMLQDNLRGACAGGGGGCGPHGLPFGMRVCPGLETKVEETKEALAVANRDIEELQKAIGGSPSSGTGCEEWVWGGSACSPRLFVRRCSHPPDAAVDPKTIVQLLHQNDAVVRALC